MAQATFHFPRGFLWGTATSSHQVEGNNTNNNWWAWEQEPGHIIHEDNSGLACDWWGGRWREDFDRARETGQNALRLSVEWSRIQPAPDRWDNAVLDRYHEMVRSLKERNITPMVTLHHFTDPIWISEMGGWENNEISKYFATYAQKVVEALGDYVTLWITINEPNVLATLGYLLKLFPPGKKDFKAIGRVFNNLVGAHAAAYHAIHKLQPAARVGIAINYRPVIPAKSWSPLDHLQAGLQNNLFNEVIPQTLRTGKLGFLSWRENFPQAKGTQDFIGLNYFSQECISFSLLRQNEFFCRRFYPSGAELSDTGFLANTPLGLAKAIHWALQFKLPILITENGIENSDDRLRQRYLVQHIHQLWRAVNLNHPIKGYFHWTLVDNFEWERGWTQRFGLWELDLTTQTRRKRPSVDLYEEICRENGLSSEMVARYAPELISTLFPG